MPLKTVEDYIRVTNEYLQVCEARTLSDVEIANMHVEWKRMSSTGRRRVFEIMEDGIRKMNDP